MITLSEQLLLLALNDEKGSVVLSASTALPYGLAGALLLELFLLNKLQFKQNKIKLTNTEKTDNALLNEVLTLLSKSAKSLDTKSCIETIYKKIRKLPDRLGEQLVNKKILVKEEKSFLWIINYNHYPMKDDKPEQGIRRRIKNIVLKRETTTEEDIALLSLIKACDLINEVFDKPDRKKAKQRIKDITENHQVGEAISKTMEEITAAIMMIIIASTVTTTIVS